MKNTYYHTCKYCGASLDPGEKCDCMKEQDSSVNDTKATDSDQQITKMCEE